MKKLTYIEDLAEELAEEHGLEYKEALEICKLNVEYAYSLTRNPEVISIRFPNLGVLHFNWTRAKHNTGAVYQTFKEIIDAQVKKVEELYKKERDVVHGRKSMYTIWKKFLFKDYKERRRATKKEIYKLIEEKQNGIKSS